MNLTKKQLTIYYVSFMFFLFSITCMLIICCSKDRDKRYQTINNPNDELDNIPIGTSTNDNIPVGTSTNDNINSNIESIEENMEENVDSDCESLFDV